VQVKTDGQDRVRTDIDLPATRIYGKVLDDAGHPMPGATVMVSTGEGNAVETKLCGSVLSARGPVPGAGVMVFGIRPGLMGGDSVMGLLKTPVETSC
jgi:hypothetical protein